MSITAGEGDKKSEQIYLTHHHFDLDSQIIEHLLICHDLVHIWSNLQTTETEREINWTISDNHDKPQSVIYDVIVLQIYVLLSVPNYLVVSYLV